jgi:hypothetical protein
MVVLAKDLAAQLDALVTDEDPRTGDEPDLVPALAAKAARVSPPVGHANSICTYTPS